MVWQRISHPMYYVECDHFQCENHETVDSENDAFLSGYHKITISKEPTESTEADRKADAVEFSSVIIWLCDECYFDFMVELKPFVPFFAKETTEDE